jgi:hypothetical protein
MIGLALISAVTVLGSSLTSVAKTVRARPTSSSTPRVTVSRTPSFRSAKQDGVRNRLRQGRRDAAVRQRELLGSEGHLRHGFPAAAIGDLVNIDVAGSDDLKPDTILMSEDAAKSRNLTPGDQVKVQFARSGMGP